VAGFGLALVTGSRQVRVFVAVALIMGFVQTFCAVTLSPYVIHQLYRYDFEGGSRYATMPIMAMTAAAVVAVDAFLRRQAVGTGPVPLIRQSARVVAVVVALACVLGLGWLSDFRYGTEHSFWGYWRPHAERMLRVCDRSTTGEITTWTWYRGRITIPCSHLRR
jgi:hypothetical protein